MSTFTPLERSAIAAITDETVEQFAILKEQLTLIRVLSRENTGGGFFTELAVMPSADRLNLKTEPLGQNVYIAINGLEYGLGMILHLKDGYANLLEGYSVGGEDTSAIDFAHVSYALISEPGPLPTSVC